MTDDGIVSVVGVPESTTNGHRHVVVVVVIVVCAQGTVVPNTFA